MRGTGLPGLHWQLRCRRGARRQRWAPEPHLAGGTTPSDRDLRRSAKVVSFWTQANLQNLFCGVGPRETTKSCKFLPQDDTTTGGRTNAFPGAPAATIVAITCRGGTPDHAEA